MTASTIPDAVIGLARGLRAAGVDASSAEVIDGLRAVEQVGVGDRLLVRAALQVTLVKRAEDVGVFDALFDRYCPVATAPRRSTDPAAAADLGVSASPASLDRLSAGGGPPRALVDAVHGGDDEALLALADG